MSMIYCDLCHESRDSDAVGCAEIILPKRNNRHLVICGTCLDALPDYIPADERAGALVNGKLVDWAGCWGEEPEAAAAK